MHYTLKPIEGRDGWAMLRCLGQEVAELLLEGAPGDTRGLRASAPSIGILDVYRAGYVVDEVLNRANLLCDLPAGEPATFPGGVRVTRHYQDPMLGESFLFLVSDASQARWGKSLREALVLIYELRAVEPAEVSGG